MKHTLLLLVGLLCILSFSACGENKSTEIETKKKQTADATESVETDPNSTENDTSDTVDPSFKGAVIGSSGVDLSVAPIKISGGMDISLSHFENCSLINR